MRIAPISFKSYVAFKSETESGPECETPKPAPKPESYYDYDDEDEFILIKTVENNDYDYTLPKSDIKDVYSHGTEF